MFGINNKSREDLGNNPKPEDVDFNFEQELNNEDFNTFNADTDVFLSGQEGFMPAISEPNADITEKSDDVNSGVFESFSETNAPGTERLSVGEVPAPSESVKDLSESGAEETPSFISEWQDFPAGNSDEDWKAPQPGTLGNVNGDIVSEDNAGDVSSDVFEDNGISVAENEIAGDIVSGGNSDIMLSEEDVVQEAAYDDTMASDDNFANDSSFEGNLPENQNWEETDTESSDEEIFEGPSSTNGISDNNFTTPVTENQENVPSGSEAGYVKWFSGSSNDRCFEIDRQTASCVIEGNAECQTVHINCGFDAYGWLVYFDNGVAMSLADVREYQLRNGCLPDQGGVIRYGGNEVVFHQIRRIVIYKSVQYFSYGV